MSYAKDYYEQKVKPRRKLIASLIFKDNAEDEIREAVRKYNDRFNNSPRFKTRPTKTADSTNDGDHASNRPISKSSVGTG